MRRPKSRNFNKQKKLSETQEIELLDSWIESGKPDSGSNPLSLPPFPKDAPIGRNDEGVFSPYTGCHKFSQLPISQKTKDGLKNAKYSKMTDIQRASLPHSICGRDILGAAKTGSGKTLAFIIPVLEKLYRAKWGPEDGVGSIIISPTRELAAQLFEVLTSVGKYHGLSAGLLIGGRKGVDTEREHVNDLNILVCTPGRLLQHMDETPNFDCSNLQVLVLDEADRILDVGFKKALNAIVSQLPKQRQTFLFSATQTKSIQDLARLSLKDPEYLSVHEESVTATPNRLQQTAVVVPLDQKLDMLWSFIKAHLNSRILVFLSTSKQVKFAFEAFKRLRPGIPLKCLYGRMNQEKRMNIYSHFCEKQSVLFSTDVASRGLDFNKGVDWVVQVDCPEDVAAYIHRVGRTARYLNGGKSVLFLAPSEMKMLDHLKEKKIPIQIIKANTKRLQPISGLLASLLVKDASLPQLAQRAFITYLKSIHIQRVKEIFDVEKLPIEEFSASLGLPLTPKVRFLKQKSKVKAVSEESSPQVEDKLSHLPGEFIAKEEFGIDEEDGDFVLKETPVEEVKLTAMGDHPGPSTRVLKKKKLKINIHRPVGSRVVFDEEGTALAPFASLADVESGQGGMANLDRETVNKRYAEMKAELRKRDVEEDKLLGRQRLKEKRMKKKMKLKRGRGEEDEDLSASDREGYEEAEPSAAKRAKVYFHSDSESEEGSKRIDNKKSVVDSDTISLAAQEELALKLLSSMHYS
ncbi:DEAD-box ATP-dependent RNA helicase 32 [Impatiens glandulifera]|uniref:DEAD-box ATP-dependent RNA helicase 32 n=1 Tax=Impatiens glandulifera TaxID=253017 RepID=UPI001FB18376|nr:DEAD-box ATP-dependent RNA helicase 32 [Impatiens glandulifera]XP_047334690.1 DEAD-box ATP-dependent RNA helicase 32 [Impatiens glandulifera]